jgi:hypothetical protein
VIDCDFHWKKKKKLLFDNRKERLYLFVCYELEFFESLEMNEIEYIHNEYQGLFGEDYAFW